MEEEKAATPSLSTPPASPPVWNLQTQDGRTIAVDPIISNWIDANFNKNNPAVGFIYKDAYTLTDPHNPRTEHSYDVEFFSPTEFGQINKNYGTRRKVSFTTLSTSSGSSNEDLACKMNDFSFSCYSDEEKSFRLQRALEMIAGCHDQISIPMTNEFESLASAFSSAFSGDFTKTKHSNLDSMRPSVPVFAQSLL